ncbi:MAG TPA: polysaccharide deacetylase family protein [Candidatus Acidoferrales bacterium]|nr:polysaccharide deacetylase family protein [Candidatus Acidoferrales bacterium]
MNRRRFLSSALLTAPSVVCAPLFSSAVEKALHLQGPALKLGSSASRPQLAITMDDPTLNLNSPMKWPEANARILKAIDSRNIRAALFVCGMRIDSDEGAKLLAKWDDAGHLLGNHSYSHLFYGQQTSYSDFAVDFLKNEKITAPYPNHRAVFRYPFLKEGDTAEKRDKFRSLLKERGYRVGHVTIDASDWYVDQRLRHRWETKPEFKVDAYRDFLIAHLLDRATFYRQLAIDVVGRDIRHTLLIHFNTLNALVLPDVMAAFESAGWQWIDASVAYEDSVFKSQPKIVPAGESLVWALAKESGRFESRLRYPGEDGEYERPKLDQLGL